MFGYLIPRSCKEALEFDKENNNTKWADATRGEMDCIKEQQVFTNTKGSNVIQTTSKTYMQLPITKRSG